MNIFEFFTLFEVKVLLAVFSLLTIFVSCAYSYFSKKQISSLDQNHEPLRDSIRCDKINVTGSDSEEKVPSENIFRKGLQNSQKTLWTKLRSIIKDNKNNEDDFYNSFEELLIESDLGVKTSAKLINDIKRDIATGIEPELLSKSIENALKNRIVELLHAPLDPEIEPVKVDGVPKVILVVGVNGAGKTTTIGKLAFQFRARGADVMLAACDTFRAAAADQLDVWSQRSGAKIERGQDGEKPSTVAYRAIQRAKQEGVDVVLIDTAGRLHTKVNLMNELSSVTNIISRECHGAPHETILVLDGSTGQNALQQAREFNAATKVSGIVVTKLDGTQKGGIVVAIKDELQIPVRYLGIGEGVGDLRPFDSREFTEALLGNFDLTSDEVLIDVSSSDSVNLKVSVNASSLE